MTINPFGGYESQSTRGLQQIDSTKYPDTNKDFEANMVRLNQFVDYISQYLQTMQKGVDSANEDVIGKLHDFSADMSELFGGGEAIYGTDLGDLQYFLPALGAIFGFDATTPFPVNLINAVEQLFLGYIVPQDAWATAVDEQVDSWAIAANLDPDFINSLHELLDAFSGLSDDWNDLMTDISDLVNAIFTDPDSPDESAFADLWNSITSLLSGLNISELGSIINPTLHSLAPWIEELATTVNQLDQVIQSWSGGVTNLEGILNFSTLFGWINFTPTTGNSFDPLAAWDALIAAVFGQSQQFAHAVATVQIPLGNLINVAQDYNVNSGFDDSSSVAPGGNWSYDNTVGRLAPGSLKVACNGTMQAAHGVWIDVQPGDNLDPQVYVNWSSLVATGVAAELQIRTNLNPETYITIATLNNPPTSGTWAQLTGAYTVPADGTTRVKCRFLVHETATAGFIWWDDAPMYKGVNLLPMSWVEGLDAWNDEYNQAQVAYATLLNSWYTTLTTGGQSISTVFAQLDAAWEAWWSSNTNINTAESATITLLVQNVLGIDPTTGWFPAGNVAGLTDTLSELGAAITGDTANSGDWSWVASIVNGWNTLTGQAHTAAINNANTLGIRNNKPVIYGLDDTTEANIPFTQATTTIPIGNTPYVTFVRCNQTDVKNTIAFVASLPSSGAATQVYVNFWSVNFTTNKMTLINTSANLVPFLSTTPAWIFTTASATAVEPGDVLMIEFNTGGVGGTVNVLGQINSTAAPVHPLANLTAIAGTLAAHTTPPYFAATQINKSAITFSNITVPYVALETSNPPPPVYPDHRQDFPIGTTIYSIDTWAGHVDLIGCGQGGGGQGETGSTVGRGGSPGSWNGQTLVVGTDIAAGGSITVTVQADPSANGNGTPGSGGAYFADGVDGYSTTFQWNKPGIGIQTLSCAGGIGGGLHNGSNATTYGQGPGDYTFNGITYPGGGATLFPQNGSVPGGSGPGGQSFQYGFSGGHGQALLVERQD